jgi:hypothetical protein
VVQATANAYLIALDMCHNRRDARLDNEGAAAFFLRRRIHPRKILNAFEDALDLAGIGGASC